MTQQYKTYTVRGGTALQIYDEMMKKGPKGKDGKRYFGYTKWDVRWSYPYIREKGSCSIGSIKVELTSTLTMPRWQHTTRTPPGLVDRWSRFRRALLEHEKGHVQNGVLSAKQVKHVLERLEAFGDCDQLESVADRLGQRVVKKYVQRDRAYDRRTHHGAVQGAVFP